MGPKDNLGRSFLEVYHRIGNWISEESGWVFELIDGGYVNVIIYCPLSRSLYNELPYRLRSWKNGLSSIKNNACKYFLYCHIWYLNGSKTHPKIITKVDRQRVSDLDYEDLNFLSLKIINVRLNQIIVLALMCFVIKMDFDRFLFHNTRN